LTSTTAPWSCGRDRSTGSARVLASVSAPRSFSELVAFKLVLSAQTGENDLVQIHINVSA
jgi:hypothetical protein